MACSQGYAPRRSRSRRDTLWGATFAIGTVLLDRVLQEQLRFSGGNRGGLLSDAPANSPERFHYEPFVGDCGVIHQAISAVTNRQVFALL
jgi:hypothetical protein